MTHDSKGKHIQLTEPELRQTAFERVHLVSNEFKSAFAFLEKYPRSVTIFGGTHLDESSKYYNMAKSLAGRIVSDLNYAVLTGGGPGIMEAANRGAFEAGGDSLGLEVELNPKQESNPYLTDCIYFHYFFSRKMALAFSAEAFVFLPGGFGTLDEFFEILTLVQTGKIKKTPIVLYGSDYWKKMESFIKEELLTRKAIVEVDLSLLQITDDEDEIIEIIRKAPVHNGVKFTHNHVE